MTLSDGLKTISENIPKKIEIIETEEATKNAFIMPFLIALGYDITDPTEVIPEFVADIGKKKGEKVDYAIMKDGEPIILIECKSCNYNLDKAHKSQLYRYFTTTSARFGVLTNGINYRFYTDIEAPNKMDDKPFFEVDLTKITDSQIEELKKFTKATFDQEEILNTASDLKYTSQMKRVMSQELSDPSEDFIKFFAKKVYDGPLTERVRMRFRGITKEALHEITKDRVNAKLKSALEASEPKSEKDIPEVIVNPPKEVFTTPEEWEGYYIIKTILYETADPERVFIRDTLSYCSVLLDNSNRKPIARLHFNTKRKYLGVFDNNREEERIPIDSANEIYKYADRIKAMIPFYDEE